MAIPKNINGGKLLFYQINFGKISIRKHRICATFSCAIHAPHLLEILNLDISLNGPNEDVILGLYSEIQQIQYISVGSLLTESANR